MLRSYSRQKSKKNIANQVFTEVKRSFFSYFFLIVACSFVFSFLFYDFLINYFNVGISYIVDQALPLVIAIIFTAVAFRKKISNHQTKEVVKKNKISIFLIVVTVISVHGMIYYHYFFSEDPITVLARIINNDTAFPYSNYIKGYPHFSYIAQFLLFGTNSYPYQVVILFYFIVSCLLLYGMVLILTNNRFASLGAALFFATTPSFLDMFTWQTVAQAPLILSLDIISLLFLFFYLRRNRSIFLLLSLVFYIASMKVGFIRNAGFIFVILFILLYRFPGGMVSLSRRVRDSIFYCIVPAVFVAVQLIPGGYIGLINLIFPILIPGGHEDAFGYRGGVNTYNYIPTLAYFITYLFLPSHLGIYLIRFKEALVAKVFSSFISLESIIFIIGMVLLFCLGAIVVVSVWKKNKKSKISYVALLGIVFIMSNIFYIPFFTSDDYRTMANFDHYFASEEFGYGPGLRYLFFSAVGASLLIGSFIMLVWKRKPGVRILGFLLIIATLTLNAYCSLYAHVLNSKSLKQYRVLADHVFQMVPRNNKVKILYSVNPLKNSIESKFSGYDWLSGFYKNNTLFYTNSIQNVKKLIYEKNVKRENIYAFYVNPETNAFANISDKVKESIFNPSQPKRQKIFFPVATAESQAKEVNNSLSSYSNFLLSSSELNKRIIFPRRLTFIMNISDASIVHFPFIFNLNVNDQEKKISPDVWDTTPYVNALKNKEIKSFEKNFLSNMQHNRDLLKAAVIGRETNRQLAFYDLRYRKEKTSALFDGKTVICNSFLCPEEMFKTSDKKLSFAVPLAQAVKRLGVTIPESYAKVYLPTTLTVYSYASGAKIKVGSILFNEDSYKNADHYRTYELIFPEEQSNSIELEITNNSGGEYGIDEISLDGKESLRFSPEEITKFQNTFYYYFEDKADMELYKTYSKKIYVLYACAEDSDWNEQLKSPQSLVNGIWKTNVVYFDKENSFTQLETSVNCYGSKLRKILIMGPQYPSKIKIDEIYLQ